jgi:hypothetical protein
MRSVVIRTRWRAISERSDGRARLGKKLIFFVEFFAFFYFFWTILCVFLIFFDDIF